MVTKVFATIALLQFALSAVKGEWRPNLVAKSKDLIRYTRVEVRIYCSFNSSPPADINWQKDGNIIKHSSRIYKVLFKGSSSVDTSHLVIKEVLASDAGSYLCVANNTHGSAEGTVKLTVKSNYAPKIKAIPNVILHVGQQFVAQCVADALPYATYTWQKKDGFIDHRVKDMKDGRLVFTGVRKADEGEYTCIASNTVGDSVESFKVKVVDDPSWIVKPVEYIKTALGARVTLTGLFTASKKQRSVSWQKNGQALAHQDAKTVEENGTFTRTTLTFAKVDLANIGRYRLTVTNDVGSIVAESILIVNSEPHVEIRQGREVSVPLGDTRILLCTVHGFPASSVSWHFDGTVMASAEPSANATLVTGPRKVDLTYAIRDAKYSDEGNYTCTGSNRFGFSNATISVRVRAIKPIDNVPSDTRKTSSKLVIIISCIAVLFVICIIAITVFLIRCQRKKPTVPPVTYSPSSNSKESGLNIDIEPGRKHSGSYSDGGGPLDDGREQGKTPTRRPLLSKYRRPTGSKSPSEENILPGHGIALEPTQLKLGEELGRGNFGAIIRKGEVVIDGETKQVAVKVLKEEVQEKDKLLFTVELETMKKISHHPNVIGLIGWCGSGDDLQIVTEFCRYGSLLNFLRTFKRGLYERTVKTDTCVDLQFELNEKDLLSFGWQVASGMRYLSSMGIVHRNLAARNVLIGHEHVCKIIDFGIAKEGICASSMNEELPLRWMGFESVFKGEFSVKSDVWSFGILLWEIATLGDCPYPGFSSADQLINALKEGYRMDKPIHCSDELHDLMMSCWQQSPAHRPDFIKLCSKTGSMLCDFNTHIDLEVLKQCFKDSEDRDDFVSINA